MKILLVLLFFFISCQPVPKNLDIEKYRRQFIQGRVEIAESLKDKIPKGDYFLILSVRGLENPMPYAVLRVKNPSLPYSFKITGKHKLRNDVIMEGKIILNARVSKNPEAEIHVGDLFGSAQTEVGKKNIVVIIDTEVR